MIVSIIEGVVLIVVSLSGFLLPAKRNHGTEHNHFVETKPEPLHKHLYDGAIARFWVTFVEDKVI
jgi:hypothetical protein